MLKEKNTCNHIFKMVMKTIQGGVLQWSFVGGERNQAQLQIQQGKVEIYCQ